MNDLLAALLLGIIEGITEFLPISSTGHLLIAERWLGHRSELFNIAIQAGAILAVTLIYRQRLWEMLLAFLGRGASPALAAGTPAGLASPAQARDYALKLLVAFGVTAVGGLLVKKLGWELPDAVRPIAWALVIGAVWMVVAEHLAAARAAKLGERRDIAWSAAVLVGRPVSGRETARSAARPARTATCLSLTGARRAGGRTRRQCADAPPGRRSPGGRPAPLDGSGCSSPA